MAQWKAIYVRGLKFCFNFSFDETPVNPAEDLIYPLAETQNLVECWMKYWTSLLYTVINKNKVHAKVQAPQLGCSDIRDNKYI